MPHIASHTLVGVANDNRPSSWNLVKSLSQRVPVSGNLIWLHVASQHISQQNPSSIQIVKQNNLAERERKTKGNKVSSDTFAKEEHANTPKQQQNQQKHEETQGLPPVSTYLLANSSGWIRIIGVAGVPAFLVPICICFGHHAAIQQGAQALADLLHLQATPLSLEIVEALRNNSHCIRSLVTNKLPAWCSMKLCDAQGLKGTEIFLKIAR